MYNGEQMYASVIKDEFGGTSIMVDLWLQLVKEEVKKAKYNKWSQKVMQLFFIYELRMCKLSI